MPYEGEGRSDYYKSGRTGELTLISLNPRAQNVAHSELHDSAKDGALNVTKQGKIFRPGMKRECVHVTWANWNLKLENGKYGPASQNETLTRLQR